MENLEKRIREEAAARGITVAELERMAGLSNGAIGKMGKSAPSYDKVVKLADALHMSMDALCGREQADLAKE